MNKIARFVKTFNEDDSVLSHLSPIRILEIRNTNFVISSITTTINKSLNSCRPIGWERKHDEGP